MSVDHWSISECETNDPSHPFPPVSCGLPCSWVYLKYYLISECIQVCSKLWPECSGTMVMFCRLFFNLAYKFIFHLKHPFNYMARCIDKLSSCVLFFSSLFPPLSFMYQSGGLMSLILWLFSVFLLYVHTFVQNIMNKLFCWYNLF